MPPRPLYIEWTELAALARGGLWLLVLIVYLSTLAGIGDISIWWMAGIAAVIWVNRLLFAKQMWNQEVGWWWQLRVMMWTLWAPVVLTLPLMLARIWAPAEELALSVLGGMVLAIVALVMFQMKHLPFWWFAPGFLWMALVSLSSLISEPLSWLMVLVPLAAVLLAVVVGLVISALDSVSGNPKADLDATAHALGSGTSRRTLDDEFEYDLDFMHPEGQGASQSNQQAAEWYRRATKRGDADAQYNLGLMHDEGKNIPQDRRKAAEYYCLAAEQDHVTAQYRLGHMYRAGEGVTLNFQEAARWFLRAAEQGNADALRQLLSLAEQGHAGAQHKLGTMYERGHGVEQDFAEADAWYNIAAASGHKGAAERTDKLGKLLLSGELEKAKERAQKHAKTIQDKRENSSPLSPPSP